MKKLIFLIPICIFIILLVNKNINEGEVVEIPHDAIRFRVIANSNSTYDQDVNLNVSSKLQESLYELLKDSKSINESRKIIKNNIQTLSNTVEKVFLEREYMGTYKINYGYNYFPEKTYKGVKYNEGNYESLKVTIGRGEGNNFWCVLFPPLCLLEAEENYDKEEVEYKSYVKGLIEKFFK